VVIVDSSLQNYGPAAVEEWQDAGKPQQFGCRLGGYLETLVPQNIGWCLCGFV
jgi:hypothetical protein